MHDNEEDDASTRRLTKRKLEAEIERLRAETEHFRRQRLLPSAEVVKAAGAVVVTIVAVGAAATAYRVTQLETKLAEIARTEAYARRDTAALERDQVVQQLTFANSQKAKLQAELQELQKRAETASAVARQAESNPTVAILGDLLDAMAALEPWNVEMVYGSCPPRNHAKLRRQLLARYRVIERNTGSPCNSSSPLTEVRYRAGASAEARAAEIVRLLKILGVNTAVAVRAMDKDLSKQYTLDVVFGLDAVDAGK